MEWLNDLDNVITLCSLIGMVATGLVAFFKARRDKKTLAEAVTLALNTLKVEGKMVDGAFNDAIVAKAEVAAEALQVGTAAKDEVMKALMVGQQVNDIKIASINGQPIYLGSALGIGTALASALRKIRGIRLRL
jgi:hypothetical protein